MAEIIIKSKKYNTRIVWVDFEDWERLSKYKWYIKSHTTKDGTVTYYALRKDNNKQVISMHREILNTPSDITV